MSNLQVFDEKHIIEIQSIHKGYIRYAALGEDIYSHWCSHSGCI